MAKTRNRRRRKHRGTQSGRVDRAGRNARPRNRQQARSQAKSRQEAKRDLPPTWGGAFRKAALAAVIFFVIVAGLFRQPVGGAISIGLFMLAIYVPMAYYFDSFLWRRRMRSKGGP